MDLQTLLDAITIGDMVGLLAAIGALWAAFKWIRPFVRGALDVFDAWNGRPARPGYEAIPGVMEQLAKLRDEVDLAKTLARDAAESAADAAFHSKPNHGSSSWDALMKQLQLNNAAIQDTDRAIRASVADRQGIHEHMSELSERLHAVVDHLGLDDNDDNGETE